MSSFKQFRRRRYGTRVRKDALPSASLLFLFSLSLCALWFSSQKQPSTNSQTKLPNISLHSAASASYNGLCTSDNVFSKKWALAFLIPGVIFSFVGLAIVTDEYFVSALERICERLKLSEDVAGATFMAAGSSAPEFFTSLLGVFSTEDEVGIGTIVGSAVFNILIIIGLSATLAGSVIQLDWRPLVRDSSFYIASIMLLLIFVLPVTPGKIDWWEGLILMSFYLIYILFMAYLNKPYMNWAGKFKSKNKPSQEVDLESSVFTSSHPAESRENVVLEPESVVGVAVAVPPDALNLSMYKDLNPRSKFRSLQYAVIAANRLQSSPPEEQPEKRSFLGIELPTSIAGWMLFPATFFWQFLFKFTIVDCSKEGRAHLWWLTFAVSIVWISVISYIMVESARISGCLIGIPVVVMGLIVLAPGTSVPDALASISVARKGAGDMAVSNAIGSNVFDILLGLGFPWFLGHLIKKERTTVTIDPISTVVIPILILFGIIIVLLALLIALKWKLRRLLGIILFSVYGVFVLYTILDVFVFRKS